jgi:hypothetical protein
MLNFDVAVSLVILFALVALAFFSAYGRVTKSAVISFGIAVFLGIWITTAACFDRPVVNVSYHPIVQQKLPDGTVVDMIAFKDEVGRAHVVNINSTLGLAVPSNRGNYQVARVRYSESKWGIRFSNRNKYEVVPKCAFRLP